MATTVTKTKISHEKLQTTTAITTLTFDATK